MPFIMVPVPEEHVNDVMDYIVRLQRQDGAELQGWDDEGMHQLFLEADEPTRSVLSFLALPGRAGKEVEPHEIAEALELRTQDLTGILGPLHKKVKRVLRRHPLIESTTGVSRAPDGRPVRRRVYVMSDEIARMVRAAELAIRQLEPDDPVDDSA